jgi:hypothetical protein
MQKLNFVFNYFLRINHLGKEEGCQRLAFMFASPNVVGISDFLRTATETANAKQIENSISS